MNRSVILARLFAGATLIAAWGITDSRLTGVPFVLILTALSAIRYRVKPAKILGYCEAAVCAAYAFIWFPALLGLWLPLIGFLEEQWRERERELFLRDCEDRAERFRLEADRETAAAELRNAARLAEITERSRIAQDIHDHVGHEISGALIALQTAVKLYENGDGRAGEILSATVKRLESASENLRETVHNLKPAETEDFSCVKTALAKLCENFEFCKADFFAAGGADGFNSPKYREILTANLKEALTNVSRHAKATAVAARLDINENYVRLTVTDNGKNDGNTGEVRLGLGLSGMKERVRKAGGTLSVNRDLNGFKIVCVLPRNEEAESETADS